MKCPEVLEEFKKACGRPPRGGRGLKLTVLLNEGAEDDVAPLAGGVD